jgi:hypothetical protein
MFRKETLAHQTGLLSRCLDSFTGEIVGARLMRLLGIGAPEEIIVVDAPTAKALNPATWIVKPWRERAKHGLLPAPRNICVRKLPGTISLRSLAQVFDVQSERPKWNFDADPDSNDETLEVLRAEAQEVAHGAHERLVNVLHYGTPEHLPADFFSDFKPEDWAAIRAAIHWQSPQRLLIDAARLFLAATSAHASNILVDGSGNLYSIDHECIEHTDLSEIAALGRWLKRGTAAHDAVRRVAELTEAAIETLFVGLPNDTTWPLGDQQTTSRYFQDRLFLWQTHFGEVNVRGSCSELLAKRQRSPEYWAGVASTDWNKLKKGKKNCGCPLG